MTAFLVGAAWCSVYLGPLFALVATAGGSYPLAMGYLGCALVGWVTLRTVRP